MNAKEYKFASAEQQNAEIERLKSEILATCAEHYKELDPAKPLLPNPLFVHITFDGNVVINSNTWISDSKPSLSVAHLYRNDIDFFNYLYRYPHIYEGGEYDNKDFVGMYDYIKEDPTGDILLVAYEYVQFDDDKTINQIYYKVCKWGTKEENTALINGLISRQTDEDEELNLIWFWRCRYDYYQIAKDHLNWAGLSRLKEIVDEEIEKVAYARR